VAARGVVTTLQVVLPTNTQCINLHRHYFLHSRKKEQKKFQLKKKPLEIQLIREILFGKFRKLSATGLKNALFALFSVFLVDTSTYSVSFRFLYGQVK